MSRTEQVREFFLAPKNMGAERTCNQLAEELGIDNFSGFAVTLFDMTTKTHELVREKSTDGRFVYRWNDKASATRDSELGGGDAKPKRGRPPKVQRKTAKRAAGKSKLVVHNRQSGCAQRAPKCAAVTRWALTEDGAFVDLTTPGVEIDDARARGLVDFIRKLDHARA
jgi:hypothetical protein